MQNWNDEAIVLATRKHGESAVILTVLTSQHGKFSGLVHGGAGRKQAANIQIGNLLRVDWQARLEDQLGTFRLELSDAIPSRFLLEADRLTALSTACAMAHAVLPDRVPHGPSFTGLLTFLQSLDIDEWPSLYVHYELALLRDLGFGLDLGQCAATGVNDGLAYVSPKSGRAVSLSAGEPYKDRLLPLPRFLVEGGEGLPKEVGQGLDLAHYFLDEQVFRPLGRKWPDIRKRLVDRIGG